MVKSGLEKLFWNPSMREDGYFYYWICDFGHFYEVRKNSLTHLWHKLNAYLIRNLWIITSKHFLGLIKGSMVASIFKDRF